MKTVLIPAPDFAPSSLPPALRVRFFANHLAEFGWKPIVLTVEPEFYETPIDPDNERLVAESVEVIRTRALSAAWTRRVGIGDLGIRSLANLYRSASRISRERQIDLIFMPVPPYFSMLLGRWLGRRGIPYVIDYIDPWVIEDYWKLEKELRPPKWALAYYSSRLLEPYALKKVAAISGVSAGTLECVLARYLHLRSQPSAVLPYGGEPADFAYLREHPRQNRCFDPQPECFYLCYTGAFIPGMFETARALFRAVKAGLRDKPRLFEKIRIYFVGSSYGQTGVKKAERLAREEGVDSVVTEIPNRIPYLDACQVLLSADGLLAVGSDAKHYTPSKVFPYILARKPILAIFHSASSLISILQKSGSGMAIPFDEAHPVQERLGEIQECLAQMLAGEFSFRPLPERDFHPYSARAMSEKLAALFDHALEGFAGGRSNG